MTPLEQRIAELRRQVADLEDRRGRCDGDTSWKVRDTLLQVRRELVDAEQEQRAVAAMDRNERRCE